MRVRRAALDLVNDKRTTERDLFAFDEIVVTPHLGASTVEAQDKAGTTIAEMVRLALRGEFVPYAVNVSAGAEVPEVVRPFLPLAERLGSILTGLADGAIGSVSFEYLGRIAEADTRALTLAALKGCLAGVVHEPVSYVGAAVVARRAQGGDALMTLTTDGSVPADVLERIVGEIGADRARSIVVP